MHQCNWYGWVCIIKVCQVTWLLFLPLQKFHYWLQVCCNGWLAAIKMPVIIDNFWNSSCECNSWSYCGSCFVSGSHSWIISSCSRLHLSEKIIWITRNEHTWHSFLQVIACLLSLMFLLSVQKVWSNRWTGFKDRILFRLYWDVYPEVWKFPHFSPTLSGKGSGHAEEVRHVYTSIRLGHVQQRLQVHKKTLHVTKYLIILILNLIEVATSVPPSSAWVSGHYVDT